MRVLVTGGAGYIGSHVCKALKRDGFTPVTLDNFSTGNRWAVRFGPLEAGDLLDALRLADIFACHRPGAVIHCAASSVVGESMVDPARYYRNNVVGTANLLETCRTFDVKVFVYSSSCATYGEPEKLPIAESTLQVPINPYGVTKLMGEQMLADYERSYGFSTAVLRYFNAAGADPEGDIGEHREVETHLVPLLLDAILQRRPRLKVFGTDYSTPDGSALRDYVHISDLADVHVAALRRLLDGKGSLVSNIGTGEPYSVLQLISAAQRITGREVPYDIAPRRPGDAPRLSADPGHFRSLFGADALSRSTLDEIIGAAWRWHLALDQGAPMRNTNT
jgi:UDP-glucose-4-epimerase GalE